MEVLLPTTTRLVQHCYGFILVQVRFTLPFRARQYPEKSLESFWCRDDTEEFCFVPMMPKFSGTTPDGTALLTE